MKQNRMTYYLIIGCIILTFGCSFSGITINQVDVGEMQYESQIVELEDAEEVKVDIRMGAGELKIDNGAEDLMEGDFTYNIESWAPEVTYNVEDQQGRLTIRQPKTEELSISGQMKNEWDLRFARGVPLDMRIDCGAGDHEIDLAEISVTALDVKMGAGNVNINLSENPELQDVEFDIGAGNVEIDLDGVWENDVDVSIQGGVGRIVLRLPNDTGVRIDLSKGVGNVDTSGLSRDGNIYTNNAITESGPLLDIHIQAGVGQIELKVSP
jgi:predicted membrane protein